MSELADLAARTAFPGRVRQFASADPGQALALAVGAAWAERSRGGHAAAVVPPEWRNDSLVREAFALARRLGLDNLLVIGAVETAVPCEPLTARERQPVRLASLGRDQVPRWQTSTPADALSATAALNPLLLLPARDPRWPCNRAALLALAWIAGDGRRVVWELPASTPLAAWSAELDLIGRMQLPIKLCCTPADLPWPPTTCGLQRWWVAMPDPSGAAGVLAWALAGEECVLAAMPDAMAGANPWLPGEALRLSDGSRGTVLCTAANMPAPTPGFGLLVMTSLIPLPIPDLAASAQPLLTSDEDLARHLATVDPHLRCTLARPSGGPDSP